ncbi:substrate-binding domain-containing protein [Actinocrispum sp. NPDC049592]|uniref:substrate-binding domain-containing protein n=1 Tax=Actinocrispum sp. NPDC049592 TaxID=3154835 RepID=UPI0034479847
MRQPSDARRQRILAVVRSRGAARVADLAEELQVSIVTVRRDVEELARAGKLRRGHGVARSLLPVESPGAPASVDGGAVALMVPERHTYLYETLHGARSALEDAGLRIVLHIVPKVAGAERPIVERALAEGVQGLLIAPRWRTLAEEEDAYGWLARVDLPIVVMERRPRRGSALHAADSVCSDHWYGMQLAVEHLLSLGHRRIVLAARDDSPTARVLRAAFAEIAAARLEDWTIVLSAPGAGADPDEEPPEFASVLRSRRATAAILHGDEDALMIVQQLAEAGIRVPQDCPVVAYDDVVAALGSTPLTAIAPPKAEVGRVAAELLLERLARPGAWRPRRIELLPELTVRGSTDRLTD